MMKEFLIENWQYLSSIIVALVSLIIVIVRKVKVVLKDTPFEKVLSYLPSLILAAEKSGKPGAEKKSFVMGMAFELLMDLTGSSVKDVSSKYAKRISDAIEDILLTPVKKEKKDEK